MKKLTVGLMVVVLFFSLAACASDSNRTYTPREMGVMEHTYNCINAELIHSAGAQARAKEFGYKVTQWSEDARLIYDYFFNTYYQEAVDACVVTDDSVLDVRED